MSGARMSESDLNKCGYAHHTLLISKWSKTAAAEHATEFLCSSCFTREFWKNRKFV
jgi:hypothetical protein